MRRSARNAGKLVDYNAEHNKALKTIVSFDTGRTSKNTGKLGSEDGKPKYPCVLQSTCPCLKLNLI